MVASTYAAQPVFVGGGAGDNTLSLCVSPADLRPSRCSSFSFSHTDCAEQRTLKPHARLLSESHISLNAQHADASWGV